MFAVSIKGVLSNPERQILLLRNERDEWELPGGRIEMGETPQERLAREFDEELGLQVITLSTALFEVIPGRHMFLACYRCALAGNYAPRLSDEHQAWQVFAPDRLPHALPWPYREAIACMLTS
ncbi:NUDIX domain-containing protein [Chitinolyticbacter meiyuanensis]|uniref:NUDIX domain-containing protein n=1 Tax=Chitinolyticbacter meiyuanensis TaxID=682798 RepID=UPI0011E60021|nr:NUDIX hydrolase [Chitinolyticbacter meiyuanensis]